MVVKSISSEDHPLWVSDAKTGSGPEGWPVTLGPSDDSVLG